MRADFLVVLTLCLLPRPQLLAQEQPPSTATTAVTTEDTWALDSPRAVMKTFLVAMNPPHGGDADFQTAISTLRLTWVNPAKARDLASNLYQVLNRIEEIDLSHLPDAPQVSQTQITSYRYFPPAYPNQALNRWIETAGPPSGSIVIALDASGHWRFTPNTIHAIPDLFAQSERLSRVAGRQFVTASGWLEAKLPKTLVEHQFLTLKYWQWLAILVVILIGLILDTTIRLAIRLSIGRVLRGEIIDDAQKELIRRTLRPFGYLAASVFWLWTLRFVGLEGRANDLLDAALKLFITATAVIAAWRSVNMIAEYVMVKAERTSTKVDDVLIPLLRKTLQVFIVVLGLIYACNALNIPIGPLVASLGIAGVAFSFAAKDTVENFFGSVSVLLDRPFDVGDWVVVDDVEGIVEEVGFRSTRIRSFYNSQITMPNSNLVRTKVDNYGRRKYRRWKTTLGVQYDTSPDQLIAFCEGIRELIRTHPYTRKDYYQVYCNEFGNSSFNILLYMFFKVPDWNTELRERDRLFIDIVRLADRLGVQFAFPTRTVHLFKEEYTPTQPVHTIPESTTESSARVKGVEVTHRLTAAQPWSSQKPPPVRIRSTRTNLAYDDRENPNQGTDEEKT